MQEASLKAGHMKETAVKKLPQVKTSPKRPYEEQLRRGFLIP